MAEPKPMTTEEAAALDAWQTMSGNIWLMEAAAAQTGNADLLTNFCNPRWAAEEVDSLPPPDGATEPPTVVDAPYVEQAGTTLTCTMGNWNNEPTSYAYQWQRDGVDTGAGMSTLAVTPGDVGHTFQCKVRATNGAGSANSMSNQVEVAAA